MQNHFGKEFAFHREGVFLISPVILALAFTLIRPTTPFQLTVTSLAIFLICPFLIARFIFRKNIRFLGFKKGYPGRGLLGIVIGWLIFLPILNLLAGQKEFQEIYPSFPAMRTSLTAFLTFQIFVFFPTFFAVQTFIFGYTYNGLKKILGRTKASFLLSFIMVPLFYLARPPMEIILSSFIAFFTCWIANRGRSILYPILFGWGLSMILDALALGKSFLP